MRKSLVFLFGLFVLLFIAPISSTMACSGYPYFGVDDLPVMELLVKATVIDTDDRGFNAIIRVEDYYKGEGAQLLTVVRYPVALETTRAVRGYDTSCLYSGRGHRWQKGSQGYFGLNDNGDGTFTDSYGGTAHFYVWNGQITYQEGATEGFALEFDEPQTISEEEFINQLLIHGERDEPIPPTVEGVQQYPLMRYLNITTENGTHYQINPDRSLSKLPEDAPLAISPDGAHVAFQLDDDTIHFQYYWTEYRESEWVFTQEVSGQDVLFTNNSHMVAVWDNIDLSVYLFDSNQHGNYGNRMRMTEVVSVKVENPTQVMWSADSSTIVWEDTTGIWRWNLFEDADPIQISDSSGLLDLSTYGRYVRFGEPDSWTLFDSQTSETFTKTIAAPTEHFLIFIGNFDQLIGDWKSDIDCQPPLRENCAVYINPRRSYESIQTFPYQMELIGMQSCGTENVCVVQSVSWHPSIAENSYIGGRFIDTLIQDIRQIEYDKYYGQPAILTGDYQIEFEFYHHSYFDEPENLPYLDYVNLKDKVDSPIASIEWGQPIFYDTFMQTATEYLP